MIITKRITRKKIQKGEPVDYNIEYITEKRQKYINKAIKVAPNVTEIKFIADYPIPYNNINESPEFPSVEKTKEELLESINNMLQEERERLIEEEQQKRLILKRF